jgi:hypothetical protein
MVVLQKLILAHFTAMHQFVWISRHMYTFPSHKHTQRIFPPQINDTYWDLYLSIYLSIYTISIYGTTALCWTLAAFSVS